MDTFTIALWVLLLSLAGTFLYFQQANLVAAASDDPAVRTRIFASIDLAAGILTLLVQALATGRLIVRFGVGPAAAFLPFVFAIGFSALFRPGQRRQTPARLGLRHGRQRRAAGEQREADVRRRRGVPVVAQRRINFWRVDPALARELVEGLTSDLLPTGPSVWDRLPHHRPRPLDEAIALVLADEKAELDPATGLPAPAVARLRSL